MPYTIHIYDIQYTKCNHILMLYAHKQYNICYAYIQYNTLYHCILIMYACEYILYAVT